MLTINAQIYQNTHLLIQQAVNMIQIERDFQKSKADSKMVKLRQELLNKPKNNPNNNQIQRQKHLKLFKE